MAKPVANLVVAESCVSTSGSVMLSLVDNILIWKSLYLINKGIYIG